MIDSSYHYSNFLSRNWIEYLRLVEEGVLSEKELLRDFKLIRKDHPDRKQIFYETFKHFLEKEDHHTAAQLLSDEHSMPFDSAMQIVSSKFQEVKFPTVAKDRADVRKALVFRSNVEFCNVAGVKESLSAVEKLAKGKLSVIFDGDIVGNSFMLAVAVAALSERIPENVAFSGAVKENGEICPAENLEEKMKACRTKNLELLTSLDAKSVAEVVDFFNSKEYHVPVYFCFKRAEHSKDTGWDELKAVVEKRFPVKNLNLYKKVYKIELVHEKSKLSEEDYAPELKKAFETLDNLFHHFSVPHLAINGPASFAMALGVATGSKKKLAVYHYQGGYHLVLDLTMPEKLREIKTLRTAHELRHFDYQLLGQGEHAAFVLHAGSHDPLPQVKEFLRDRSDTFIVYVHARRPGNVELGDWTEHVSELFSITQLVKRERVYHSASFFLSCPVAMAFGFGMALGEYVPGQIYQYDSSSGYLPVFKIEEIPKLVLSNLPGSPRQYK